jgi:metallo-beta-lactamase class B
VAAAVAAAVIAEWLHPSRPDVAAVPPLPARPVAVVPGVYLLGRTSPAAAYAVETSDGLVLVDSGIDATAAEITGQLAELHLDHAKLNTILLTHGHADHSLGAARLREKAGAKVYAGRADCPPLRAGGPREAFFSTYYMPKVATHKTEIDVELTGDEVIAMGDSRFTALATPGHTPGSVCYLLERHGLRVLFTGDVIQGLDPANPGALGTYAAYLAPAYRGDAADYLATLRRLRGLPLPDLVLPGHPRDDKTPQSPHPTPERWQTLLDHGIAAMETLLERRKADGANFLDGHPKELLPGLRYLGDAGESALYGLATPKGLFLFDAPALPSPDFLAERLAGAGWAGRKPTAVILTSADSRSTAGLAALVKATGCKVVAPAAGLDAVRRACPSGTEILTEKDLEKGGWFDVLAMSLKGRGAAPVAYRVTWANKTVLISGLIPVKLSPPTAERLLPDVPTGAARADYVAALAALADVAPDLWLPATPVYGQNANLYDTEWADVLASNKLVFMQ